MLNNKKIEIMNRRILSFVAGVALVVGFSACEKEVEEVSGVKNSPGHDQYESLFENECINEYENFMGKDTYKSWGNQAQSSGERVVGPGIVLWKQGNQTELRFADDAKGIFVLGYHSGNYYNAFVFDAECVGKATFKFDGKVYSTLKWHWESGDACDVITTDLENAIIDAKALLVGKTANCWYGVAELQALIEWAEWLVENSCDQATIDAAEQAIRDAMLNVQPIITASIFFVKYPTGPDGEVQVEIFKACESQGGVEIIPWTNGVHQDQSSGGAYYTLSNGYKIWIHINNRNASKDVFEWNTYNYNSLQQAISKKEVDFWGDITFVGVAE